MKFSQTLQPAIFLRRYKRFLADVRLPDGTEMTVHCPNTGSMKGCLSPGCEVGLFCYENPKRKYPFTLEMIKVNRTWVGVNTSRTNALVKEALLNGVIAEIDSPDLIQAEVKVSPQSRLDFLIKKGHKKIYMEVKNCTYVEEGVAMFPDAVTNRGTRHLRELTALCAQGYEAMVLFCVQRTDTVSFSPAWHIDPVYSQTLSEAVRAGVQALAYQAEVGPDEIKVVHGLPVILEN